MNRRQLVPFALIGGLLLATTVPAPAQAAPARAATTSAATNSAATDSAATTRPGSCQEVALPLSVGAQDGLDLRVSGTMCRPTTWSGRVRAVDLLVHGGMYNRSYWDPTIDPELYSYLDRTLAAGRATFSYDRIGVGGTTRPLSTRGTLANDVDVLHQLVQWLRPQFGAVNLIGHSLGSVIAVQEAGTYHDVDRLVVTGLTHGHGLGLLTLPTVVYPAQLDPLWRLTLLRPDPGYLTTRPGTRASLFYSPSADPAMIAWDESHKDMMSDTETAGAITALTLLPIDNLSSKITAPVLVIVGQQDAPFCNVDVDCGSDAGLAAHEAPYYSGAAGFTARTVPGTGHDLPLHPSAGTSFAMINSWIRAH